MPAREPDRSDPLASGREWLSTDGRGGFACGTWSDLPTRRYHSWLTARVEGREERICFLSRNDEFVATPAGERSLLSALWAQGTLQAPGCELSFAARPLPAFEWSIGCLRLRRTIAVTARGGEVLVAYQNLSQQVLRLRLRPLLAFRRFDRLRAGSPPDPSTEVRSGRLRWQPERDLPPLWASAETPLSFVPEPVLYRGISYELDAARGYDHVEDLFSPGSILLTVPPGERAVLSFSVGEPRLEVDSALDREKARREEMAAQIAERDLAVPSALAIAARDFFWTDGGRTGILAGFPWFSEWGRDTFIALPGLTLSVGDTATCEAVLKGALPFLRDGLLPNIYGADRASSHYGSADAALWFTLAVLRWQRATGRPLLPEFREALIEIAQASAAGQSSLLRMDEDGLLVAGDATRNATWMDAVVDGIPVTPRYGRPVEINALWYSLLAHLASQRGRDTREFRALRDRCGLSFSRCFWLEKEQRLADVAARAGESKRAQDAGAIRPNMVIAAALEFSPLSSRQRAGVVAAADRHLWTPFGLRTLAPGDPAYCGRYEGPSAQRDRAYHQGTAWPWLIGYFVEAALRSVPQRQRPALQAEFETRLAALVQSVCRGESGLVPEVYDGDEPQRPGGCFAQAWSTAELIRALTMCRDGLS
ncbi:MAG: amylo-alpha-1,6-glucosidase [Planctomycetota bacterium]